ncbi:hypothetical protein ACFL1H_08275, partial [Nanoarchaeota archaeon]
IDKVIKGKTKIKNVEKTIIMTPEIFSKIFSPQRLKLILKMKNNIKNIYQLAKEMNRKYEAVYRDIKLLEGFGIINIKDKERQKIPYIDESINIPAFA